jgi:hypothetical protein
MEFTVGTDQVDQHLPSRHRTLSSILNTEGKTNKQEMYFSDIKSCGEILDRILQQAPGTGFSLQFFGFVFYKFSFFHRYNAILNFLLLSYENFGNSCFSKNLSAMHSSVVECI